jgi:hypothetical protein
VRLVTVEATISAEASSVRLVPVEASVNLALNPGAADLVTSGAFVGRVLGLAMGRCFCWFHRGLLPPLPFQFAK